MNEELKLIFGDSISIGTEPNIRTVPTAHLRYKGSSRTFLTWTITSDKPSFSADDEELISIVEVDVDIYSETNFKDVVKKVKQMMKSNNWVWVGDSSEMFEEDTELYHITCTFDKERSL